jgi:hypothetical protein
MYWLGEKGNSGNWPDSEAESRIKNDYPLTIVG